MATTVISTSATTKDVPVMVDPRVVYPASDQTPAAYSLRPSDAPKPAR